MLEQNYERVEHKIAQNEDEHKEPGYAYVYDLIRATARYDVPEEMLAAIKGITSSHKVVKFENKLLGDLRSLIMVIQVGDMLAEIQVVFSPDALAPNSHMNRLLHEVEGCSNLNALSKAIQRITTKTKKECVAVKAHAPLSGNSSRIDSLYQKHYSKLS